MENMSPESLLRKAQALGDDIKEMESIDVLGAYYQAQAKIKTNRRKNMYNQLMRYAAFLTIPLFLSSLVLGYLYFSGTETDEKYAEVGGKKEDIKVIGIRHGEKMYETLLTNEECAHAIDMGNFYRVPCDKRGLNYDKYFTKGNVERAKLSEFNSNNTKHLTVEETKAKIASLAYIQEELAKDA